MKAGPIAALASLAGRVSGTQRGMALILFAALTSTIMSACIRQISTEMHPFEVAFFRCLFGILFFLPALIRRGLEPLRTARPVLHAMRGLLNGVGMILSFLALSLTALAKVTALSFAAPLFTTLIAVVALGEALKARRTTALVVGFVGTWVILRPGIGEVDLGSVLALGAAATWGVGMILIKVQSRTETSLTITLYSTCYSAVITLLAALPEWQAPTVEQLAWLAVIGALGSLGNWNVAQAFKEAEVTAVLPLDFTKLIWAALLGYLLFDEVPEAWTWIGGGMIFAAATYIAIRERAAKPKAGPAG